MTSADGKFRILAIEGGGVRGLVPGLVLAALERRLRAIDAELRVADLFDLVAGVGTGGLLACALLVPDEAGRPRHGAPELIERCLERVERTFGEAERGGSAASGAPSAGLADALESCFGDVRLDALVKPCVITAHDARTTATAFFSRQEARRAPEANLLVRDVALATSTGPHHAPTPTRLARSTSLIDGGAYAANPALSAYVEATKLVGGDRETYGRVPAPLAPRDVVLVSLGCGSFDAPGTPDAVGSGALCWMGEAIGASRRGPSRTAHAALAAFFADATAAEQYVRLDLPLPDELRAAPRRGSPDDLGRLVRAVEGLVDGAGATLDGLIARLRPEHGRVGVAA